jgi:DNA-binding PucR family transcriptional regulator
MAQRRNIRAEETVRRELIETLLTGDPVDELWFADQARQTGFPVRGPYQVAVGVADEPLGDADPIQIQLERDLGQTYATTDWVAQIRRGELVVMAAGPQGVRASGLDAALSQDRSREWHVGVGDVQVGVSGIEVSYRQAREAQSIGSAFGRGRVTTYSEIPIERLLNGHRAVVAELGSRVVAPLAGAGRGDLLETLEAYLGCGGNTAEAARRLSVGSRTVGYRLERIAELTGCSPRDPDDRLLLELAMRARPLMVEV